MSEERDPRVIHVAPDLPTADRVAAWLGEKGYKCEVVLPDVPALAPDGIGLTEAARPGVEIRAIDVDQAEPARTALGEAIEFEKDLRARRDERAGRTGTVTAACEECGKASDWPAADQGTTQVCPHCLQYMDVPDPDDDWGDVDFGTEDGEGGGAAAPDGGK